MSIDRVQGVATLIGSMTPITVVLTLIGAMSLGYVPVDHELSALATLLVLGGKLIDKLPNRRV